ncbi:MAG: Ig-like domain-containing protein [Leifsonia sp.]
MPSRAILPAGAVTIVSTALMLATDTTAAHATVALKPAHVTITGSIAEAGGIGQARAYWQNTSAATRFKSLSVKAQAPEGQTFQSSGSLVLRTLSKGASWVALPESATIEETCVLSADRRSLDCALPTPQLDQDAYYSIGFPTFVSPGAAVSSEPTSTSNATLTVDGVSVATALQTFVGSRSTLTNRVDEPEAGQRNITGQANPGTTVTLTGAGSVAGGTTADTHGEWSIVLPEGFGMVEPRFTDVSGLESTTSAFYYNSYTFTASLVDSDSSLLGGSGQPGSIVDVLGHDGTALVSTRIAESGQWQVTLPAAPFENESATVVNTLSNGSTTRLSVVVAALSDTQPVTATATSAVLSAEWSSVEGQHETVRLVTVSLTDSTGRPIPGEVVRFSTSGPADVTAPTAVTDHNGEATMTVITAPRALFVLTAEGESTHARTTLSA